MRPLIDLAYIFFFKTKYIKSNERIFFLMKTESAMLYSFKDAVIVFQLE